jgi:hypothetical protein
MTSLGQWTMGALVAASLAGPAAAQEAIDGTNPEAIVDILKGFGIARLETASSTGNPKISGRADGKAYEVFFYGCDDAKANCNSIQFWAYWDQDAPLETINGWNKDTRYGKVYVDQDSDIVLEYDVNLLGGISAETLEDNAVIWVQLLARVEEDVVGE